MRGESVTVFTRLLSGRDDMGEPMYSWVPETVDNVLVRPIDATDVASSERPDGIQVKYRLAFPKTYTKSLRHRRVAMRDMDAENADAAYSVVGDPDYVSPCPTEWNRLAEIGRRDG